MLSKNGLALIVYLFSFAGFQVAETDVAQVAAAVAQLVSFGTMLYNQYDRRDVKWFFWKK